MAAMFVKNGVTIVGLVSRFEHTSLFLAWDLNFVLFYIKLVLIGLGYLFKTFIPAWSWYWAHD